jgi:hypothetical protein
MPPADRSSGSRRMSRRASIQTPSPTRRTGPVRGAPTPTTSSTPGAAIDAVERAAEADGRLAHLMVRSADRAGVAQPERDRVDVALMGRAADWAFTATG